MALLRYNVEAPVRTALVELSRVATRGWLQWFQIVGDRLGSELRLDTPFDPPNLAAGAATTINVTVPGVAPPDGVKWVSFEPMTVGGVANSNVRFFGNVTAANTVSVSLLNVSGGPVDLDAGTLFIQVERVQ